MHQKISGVDKNFLCIHPLYNIGKGETYNPRDLPAVGNHWHIVSIDPAPCNYAIRVTKRYSVSREVLLYTKFSMGKPEKWDRNARITKKAEAPRTGVNGTTINTSFITLHRKLREYREHFIGAHIILVEKQRDVSYLNTRCMQATIDFFIHLLDGTECIIVEVDSRIKSNMLDGPKGVGSVLLKKWAVEKAKELLTEDGDEESLTIINDVRKKDDLADVVVMEEAMIKKWGLTAMLMG